MFTTVGTVRYSPPLVGDRAEAWWVVLDCDPEVGRYYRHLYHLAERRTRKLIRPAWHEHVTVVRNEEPPRPAAWRRHEGATVEIECDPVGRGNDLFYWLDVRSAFCDAVRSELGLGPPRYPYHLTIGNAKG